ncbi:Spindle assembly abnormal protein 6 [Gonapodya sp. JEL0774]|nr:Spindle assembly abnormal protein 6 [Gonapodya sp. JEL0774]
MSSLHLHLLDPSNPLFLYLFRVSESEYPQLARDQQLVVEWDGFGNMVGEMLERAGGTPERGMAGTMAQGQGHNGAQQLQGRISGGLGQGQGMGQAQGKFLVILTLPPATHPTRPSHLTLLETTPFRHVVHLHLPLLPAPDSALKRHLSDRITSLTSHLSTLSVDSNKAVIDLTRRLAASEEAMGRVTGELDREREARREERERWRAEREDERERERRAWEREREEERERWGRERKEMAVKFEEQLKALNSKSEHLTTTNAHLVSHTASLESQLTSTTASLSAAQVQLTQFREQLDTADKRYKKLEREREEEGRERERERERGREAERRAEVAEGEVRRLGGVVEVEGGSKAKLEESLSLYRAQTARLEASLKQSSEEIAKGNDIIRRLQTDLRTVKSKLKLKNVVTVQQEKLLEERQVAVEALTREVQQLREEVKKREEEGGKVEERLKELERQVEEGRKTIEDNNNVIEWLHKQLNEDPIHRPLGGLGGFSGISTGYSRSAGLGGAGASGTSGGLGGLGGLGGVGELDFDKYAPLGGREYKTRPGSSYDPASRPYDTNRPYDPTRPASRVSSPVPAPGATIPQVSFRLGAGAAAKRSSPTRAGEVGVASGKSTGKSSYF